MVQNICSSSELIQLDDTFKKILYKYEQMKKFKYQCFSFKFTAILKSQYS